MAGSGDKAHGEEMKKLDELITLQKETHTREKIILGVSIVAVIISAVSLTVSLARFFCA